MNRSSLKRLGCFCALLALSGPALIDAGSAIAQTTNSTGAQTRPESPGQVSPDTTKPQNTSTFTPPKPGSQPTPPAGDNSKKEK